MTVRTAFTHHTSTAEQALVTNLVAESIQIVGFDVTVISPTPIERVEIRNGAETVKTLRGYSTDDLGSRYRVIWSGAEYRGPTI